MANKKFDKLNIGCGNDVIDGWLNIALFPENIPYGVLGKLNGADVLSWDMTKDIMLPENSVKYIYASHFIEHLPFPECVLFFETCYKLLKSDGVLRISCPDIGLWISKYHKKDDKFFKKYRDIYFKDNLSGKFEFKTNLEIFMGAMYLWGHKWGYDIESLEDIFKRVGFKKIEHCKPLIGNMVELKKIEPREEGRLLESLYIEATK